MITMRQALTGDTDGWLELLDLVQESFPGLDLEEYQAILRRKITGGEALVALDGPLVAGALLFSEDSGELEFLAVHPKCRRQGIAAALVGHMLGLFPPGRTVTVTTYREGDAMGAASRAFYISLGFTPGALVTVFDYPCQVFARTV